MPSRHRRTAAAHRHRALLISCWTGPVAAIVLIAAPVLGAYTLPCLFRALALRRAVRRPLR
ncbi:hypothetical protein [Streptomyces sp. 1222.5]|uniref:hypothetical protein n=1 Tax=Streptomyces sp. 1222.5 TaxID=1881026 RepID=UPI003EBC5888